MKTLSELLDEMAEEQAYTDPAVYAYGRYLDVQKLVQALRVAVDSLEMTIPSDDKCYCQEDMLLGDAANCPSCAGRIGLKSITAILQGEEK